MTTKKKLSPIIELQSRKEMKSMFEIKEVSKVEGTGSLWGSVISCFGTWAAVGLLYAAVCC